MYQVSAGDQTFEITLDKGKLLIDGNPFDADISFLSERDFHLLKDSISYRAELIGFEAGTKTYSFRINNQIIEVSLKDKLDLLLERLGMDDLAANTVNDVVAPMPGLILDIQVSPGDTVTTGDPLLILEAMKMENVIKAGGDGKVKEILTEKGKKKKKGQVLIRF